MNGPGILHDMETRPCWRRGLFGVWVLIYVALVGLLLLRPDIFPAGGFAGCERLQSSLPRGIRLAGDSNRYIDGAANLLSGKRFEEKQASYIGYVVVVAMCQWTGLGLPGVVALQVAAGALTALFLFLIGRRLGDELTGHAAVLLYIINLELAAWHTFIHTESLYILFTVAGCWAALAAVGRPGLRHVAALAAFAAAASMRPNGWLLLPICLAFWVAVTRLKPWTKWCLAAGVFLAFLMVVGATPHFKTGVDAEHPVHMLYIGEVMWGYEPWRLAMPPADAPQDTTWHAGAVYALKHPMACATLGLARVGAELGHLRPFYSGRHNLVLVVYPVLYVLALIGGYCTWRTPTARLLAAVIGGHLFIIAITFANRDGRFLVVFLPLLFLFSAHGIRVTLRTLLAPRVGRSSEGTPVQ